MNRMVAMASLLLASGAAHAETYNYNEFNEGEIDSTSYHFDTAGTNVFAGQLADANDPSDSFVFTIDPGYRVSSITWSYTGQGGNNITLAVASVTTSLNIHLEHSPSTSVETITDAGFSGLSPDLPLSDSGTNYSVQIYGAASFDMWSLSFTVEERPGDRDNDGALDDVDNCIDVPNAEQADLDSDGFGDACDVCLLDDAYGDADDNGVCDPWIDVPLMFADSIAFVELHNAAPDSTVYLLGTKTGTGVTCNVNMTPCLRLDEPVVLAHGRADRNGWARLPVRVYPDMGGQAVWLQGIWDDGQGMQHETQVVADVVKPAR